MLSSGYSEAEVLRRFTAMGITDVLQKPYNVEELTAKIERVLTASAARGA